MEASGRGGKAWKENSDIEEYEYGYGSFIYYDILFAFILTRLYFYKNRNKSKREKIAYYRISLWSSKKTK